MFTLSALQLRFTCEALTPIRLNGYSAGRQTPGTSAGAQLRGALGNVMRRAYCGHALTPTLSRSETARTGEGAGCPVCWLLAADEHPGEERRGYALVPPRETCQVCVQHTSGSAERDENLTGLYSPGQRFDFGLTLFGAAQRYLPYFILAVPEMGRNGVGSKMPHAVGGPGRGRFALRSVTALDPLDGRDQIVLAEGESLVHVPDRLITAERVQQAADRTLTRPSPWQGEGPGEGRVHVNFLTPMRLIDDKQLVKAPDFGVLFKRLLERLDELNQQFAGSDRRAPDEIEQLQALANQVRLVDAQTRWIELKSGSSRSGRATWLSGFAGPATYAAPLEGWRALLRRVRLGASPQGGEEVGQREGG